MHEKGENSSIFYSGYLLVCTNGISGQRTWWVKQVASEINKQKYDRAG